MNTHRTLEIPPLFRLPPLLPESADYDRARRVWNACHDRHPAAVIRCSSTAEIAAGVRFAADRGLPLAVRGGGHSFPGYGSCDGGIVLNLGPLSSVKVDSDRRVAVAGGGATWADVDRATASAGLAVPGGLVSTTGVGGLTLGGGIGWLSRRWGLACDQLIAAEVVLADGSLARTSEAIEPELLWALRGGGGNFGIVSRFEFRLHELPPAGEVLGGMVLYDAGSAPSVLRAYARLAPAMPDPLSTLVAFINVPPLPFLPEALHGAPAVAIALCDVGEPAEADTRTLPLRRLAAPLADLVQRLPYVELQRMLDPSAPAGLRQYAVGVNLQTFDDGAIAALGERAAARPTPLSQIHVHQLGGAVARIAEGATAYAGRDAPYVVNIIATWTDTVDDERARDWARETRRRLADFAAPTTYVNFLGEAVEQQVRLAYGTAKHDRLRELKRRFDPTNLFRINANILPAD
ncbi:MAG TPA: FAD-binding oxidoreductase [Thermoanaerobaculales bacterium]|nr:FAD-binding oxidoreductase [Thermoanaerobaculales bacterium]HQL28804.1 FAD-binding oxidoreductase [Thermoanaerobaculales bacterium]HQN96086.1 FAD-binding oxidoreductase [Thermoanaerobaculales bacterium]HQP43090.1 FAD-binding oxidoreductase [Thermoanaerobaculales bacterium]